MLLTPSPLQTLARVGLLMSVLAATACGGGGGAASGPSVEPAQALVRKIALATPTEPSANAAPGVDADALMDWAQWQFPSLFPATAAGPQTFDLEFQGVRYAVRAYDSGNHLGITGQGQIFGLGPFTALQLQSFGFIAEWAPQVRDARCQVYPRDCAPASGLDNQLRSILAAQRLTGDPTVGRQLPNVADPLPLLGKLLFFSKSLSAGRDTACASCHHPALGGGDGLAVSIGANAQQPDLVGPGRRRADGRLLVARNANTFFNIALYDRALFWDGRVESLLGPGAQPSPSGAGTTIRTPDSGAGADPAAGPDLAAAQARFPIPVAGEMRGDALLGLSDEQLRQHIATRLAGEAGSALGAGWLPHFHRAFDRPAASAAELITFDNITRALSAYQRSAVFTKSPWQRYLLGENAAIDDFAKNGALLFYRDVRDGGAGCAQCHGGDFFTDEKFHATGFPQAGPGFTADGSDNGRERVSGNPADRLAFRTPSLLNVEITGPWGHAGTYDSLDQVFTHYAVPDDTVSAFLRLREWCRIAPFVDQPDCAAGAATVSRWSLQALDRMSQLRRSDPANAMPVIDLRRVPQSATFEVVSFMRALTDPCVKDRACLARWIPRPDEAPDAHQLNAVDFQGRMR